MENLKVLNISGGGTKIVGLIGFCVELLRSQKYKPNVISGISAGCLISLPLALGKYKELYNLCDEISTKTMFSVVPLKPNGKPTIRGLIRVLLGKNSLGKMDNLKSKIVSLVTEDEFYEYKLNKSLPNVVISSVNLTTGSRNIMWLKDESVTYDDYVNNTLASASIPIITEPICVGHSKVSVDGGMRNSILSAYLLKTYGYKIMSSLSVYSSPKDKRKILNKFWKPNGTFSILNRTIEILINEISIRDRFEEEELLKKNHISGVIVNLPPITKSTFDVNKSRLRDLFVAGKQLARRINTIK